MRTLKKPIWLTVRLPETETLDRMKMLLDIGHLHTVCESAHCPNIGECFTSKTCTFMILGKICTRNCRFCAIDHGNPSAVASFEPRAIASAARKLELRHVVVTSVTRDDLPDGGAGHFAATIKALHDEMPDATIEVLIPDFGGSTAALQQVIDAGPDIVNHNIDTVPRLYPIVRPQAVYCRSLSLLQTVSEAGRNVLSKSGLMLGMGENIGEVIGVMEDLRSVHCAILTIGQYLSPSSAHYPVVEYVPPDTFKRMKKIGYDMGFLEVNTGPLVRSSYHAARSFSRIKAEKMRKWHLLVSDGKTKSGSSMV